FWPKYSYMRFLTYLIVLLLANYVTAQDSRPAIIPEPVEMQTGAGVFELTSNSGIGYNNAAAENAAFYLQSILKNASGFDIRAGLPAADAPVQLVFLAPEDAEIGKEGYRLSVTASTVTIRANQPAGLFYGIQSFL